MSTSTRFHHRSMQPLWAGLIVWALSSSVVVYSEEAVIKLTAVQIKTAGITVAAARSPGTDAASIAGSTLRLAGRVTVPNRGIEIVSATTASQVQAVLVNVGEPVRIGTPLAKLHSPELLSMQREYLHARSAAALGRQKLERDEALFDSGIIARSRLEDTRNAQAQAQTSLLEQQHLLKLSGLSTNDIHKLTDASDITPVLTVTSGLNGVVLEQTATPGSRVEPGTPLFKLGNTHTLWVELQATPAQLGQLRVGNQVTATGCQQPGKLIALSPQVSRDSQTALVRAEFVNAGTCLRPNQYAEVSINAGGDNHAVVSIPAKALLRSSGKDYVFVQTPAGFKLQEVAVQTRQGDQAWVSDTLAAGTQVVVSGLSTLRGAASGLGSEE